jgi:hypothetical protein
MTRQLVLDLGIEIQRDVGGIEMGVLENGIAYLSQTGLAKVCGVTRSVIQDLTTEWEESFSNQVTKKGRLSFLQDRLSAEGFSDPRLYIEIKRNGAPYYAYPDIVCMAIIEYYAFEAQQADNQAATDNYRKFAQHGMRQLVYQSVGYQPVDSWRYHNDRASLIQNSVPVGYFSVFQEISGMIIDLINNGVTVSDKTIPDISVGLCWGKKWTGDQFDEQFGSRSQYEHNYPSYYSQAQSNPQKPWAYPDAALPEFRRWFRAEYLPTKFPPYILKKAKQLEGGQRQAQQIAQAFSPKRIT